MVKDYKSNKNLNSKDRKLINNLTDDLNLINSNINSKNNKIDELKDRNKRGK